MHSSFNYPGMRPRHTGCSTFLYSLSFSLTHRFLALRLKRRGHWIPETRYDVQLSPFDWARRCTKDKNEEKKEGNQRQKPMDDGTTRKRTLKSSFHFRRSGSHEDPHANSTGRTLLRLAPLAIGSTAHSELINSLFISSFIHLKRKDANLATKEASLVNFTCWGVKIESREGN